VSAAERRARLALTALLAAYGGFLILHPDHYGWLDGLDLAIHEFGHPLFRIFGEFVGFLGGTLMQLLMPALFVAYFWRRGDRHAAMVGLWWVAQNLWNVAVYVQDARAQELPLVGGGEHDWSYLLGRLGLLQQDRLIGGGVRLVGVMLYVWSCLMGWTYASGSTEPS
jgi:hypothetical protein